MKKQAMKYFITGKEADAFLKQEGYVYSLMLEGYYNPKSHGLAYIVGDGSTRVRVQFLDAPSQDTHVYSA
jgi:hypothetical protein